MNADNIFLSLIAAAFSTFAVVLFCVSAYVKLEDRQRAKAPVKSAKRAGAGYAAGRAVIR